MTSINLRFTTANGSHKFGFYALFTNKKSAFLNAFTVYFYGTKDSEGVVVGGGGPNPSAIEFKEQGSLA